MIPEKNMWVNFLTTKEKVLECKFIRLTYPNGKIYKGYFKEDKPDGEGELSHIDGRVVIGYWEKGIMTRIIKEQTNK